MNMNNLGNKMMNQFFRKVSGVKWDLMTGRVGVQTDDGIVTLEGSGDDAQLVINLMDQFGMAIPAFAQNTPLESVAVGDLIYQGTGAKGWVVDVIKDEDGSVKRFRLLSTNGNLTSWNPPKVTMLGWDSGVMVLRSLINLLPGGKAGLDNMKGFLMPMLMLGGDMNMDKMMPFLLFSQLGSTGDGTDAMGLNNNVLQTMLLMQMMKGNHTEDDSPFDAPNFFDKYTR